MLYAQRYFVGSGGACSGGTFKQLKVHLRIHEFMDGNAI